MKKRLYEIEQQYLEISEALAYGELTPELEQALEITREELQTKAVNYGFIIKEAECDIEVISSEIARLTAMKKAEQRRIDLLKERIENAMQMFGIEKVDSPVMKLSLRSSESVEIINESQLDAKYVTEKTTYTPNKAKIKEAIKAGETVEGAVLRQNSNLQIR